MKDKNLIFGRQVIIVRIVILQNEFAQIKRNQNSFPVGRVFPFDQRVIHVSFALQILRLVDQIPDLHPGRKGIFPRTFDIAPQINGVGVHIHNGKHLDQIRILKHEIPHLGERLIVDIDDNLFFIFNDPFHLHLLRVGAGNDAAGQFKKMLQVESVFEFINRRPFDVAGNADQRTGDGYKNHIARLQDDIFGLVAFQEKIIQVEFGHDPVFSAQFHASHRADGRRTARQHERIGNGCQCADRIRAGTFNIAQNKNGNRPGGPHGNINIRSYNLFGFRNEVFGHFTEGHARHLHGTDIGNRDFAVPVHHERELGAHPPP